jgi:hypothetical protein
MANYLDGMDGGKHNSDNTEHEDNLQTYSISLTFTDIQADNPLEAVKKILDWLEDANTMIYDVEDELTGNKFTVDLSEDDDNAVLPNNDNPVIQKNKLIDDIQKIVKEFGSFSTADISADCDISIPTNGNHIHLANIFNYDNANVEVYEDGGENEIDSYSLSYRDMDIEQLQEVFEFAQQWEAECLADEDRQGVNQ